MEGSSRGVPAAPVPIQAARCPLGWLFIFSGSIHVGLMVFAALYSQGWVPVPIPAQRWELSYFIHLLGTVAAGVLFILLCRSQGVAIMLQLSVDLGVGVFVFDGLFKLIGSQIAAGRLSPWLALIASVWLLFYGRRLKDGRQVWSKLDLL